MRTSIQRPDLTRGRYLRKEGRKETSLESLDPNMKRCPAGRPADRVREPNSRSIGQSRVDPAGRANEPASFLFRTSTEFNDLVGCGGRCTSVRPSVRRKRSFVNFYNYQLP